MTKTEKVVESAEKTAETKTSTKSNFFWKLLATGVLPIAILAVICLVMDFDPFSFLWEWAEEFFVFLEKGECSTSGAVIGLLAALIMLNKYFKKSWLNVLMTVLFVVFSSVFGFILSSVAVFFPTLVLAALFLFLFEGEMGTDSIEVTYIIGLGMGFFFAKVFPLTGCFFLLLFWVTFIELRREAFFGLKKYWTFLKK